MPFAFSSNGTGFIFRDESLADGVLEKTIPATTNQACAAIVLIEPSSAHKGYLKLIFEKSYDEIRDLSTGCAQPKLNVGKVKTTLIPLPPLAEQSRIITRANELRALCAQLKQGLSSQKTVQAQLTDTLVSAG